MLVLIEGTDGSGKSTLANNIADALHTANPTDKIEIRHCGPLKASEHPLDAYTRPLLDYVPGTGHHIIYDRHFLGEWIYPGELGRATLADLPTFRYIDMFLQSKGAVLVHATAPIQDIIANVTERGDDLIKVRQLQGIHAAYSAMMKASRLPKIRYAAIGNPFIPGEAIRLARYMEGHVVPLRDFVTYVGHQKPRFLLLGDVRHNLRDTAQDLIPELTRGYGPAFGPYRGTSGHFLLQHLPFSVIHEGVGLANACDVDDVSALWETLGKPATVALGQNAAKCATWAKQVKHPAYVRRFKSNEGPGYGMDIADTLGLYT